MSDLSRHVAAKARISVVKMTSAAKAAHTGSSLSLIDMLSVIYVDVLSNESKLKQSAVLISKGHAAAGVYAVMAHAGKFPVSKLDTYCSDGSELGGHVTQNEDLGVEFSTGSLGHALPYAVGVSLANKLDGLARRTFVIISDGECDEGSNWEAALLAGHHELSNLVVLIDRNRLQSLGDTEDTVRLEPLRPKWEAFGWEVLNVNGHDHDSLLGALTVQSSGTPKPRIIICETTKGHGVSFMENSVVWHYRPPLGDDLVQALSELGDA